MASLEAELGRLGEPTWLDQVEKLLLSVDTVRVLQAFGAGLLGQKAQGAKPIAEQAVQQIGRLLRARLQAVQANRQLREEQSRRTAALQSARSLKQLMRMDPGDFEHWTKGYFERYGFKDVVVTQLSNDFGIDVIMKTGRGQPAVAQCKRYKGTVGRPTVQQTYGAMKLVGAKHCYVVTTGRFTEEAMALSERRDIHLLDGQFIVSDQRPPGA